MIHHGRKVMTAGGKVVYDWMVPAWSLLLMGWSLAIHCCLLAGHWLVTATYWLVTSWSLLLTFWRWSLAGQVAPISGSNECCCLTLFLFSPVLLPVECLFAHINSPNLDRSHRHTWKIISWMTLSSWQSILTIRDLTAWYKTLKFTVVSWLTLLIISRTW